MSRSQVGYDGWDNGWDGLIANFGRSNAVKYSCYNAPRRITETNNGQHPTELYYSAQGQVIEEDVNNSGLSMHTQEYWSPVYQNALICRDYDYNNNGSIVASKPSTP